MSARLWIPGPLPGLNEMLEGARAVRGKGSVYATMKDSWGHVVWATARASRLPRFDRRVQVHFEWTEKERRRDPDNVRCAAKFILDGLVKAEVLAGDGWKHIAGLSDTFSVDPRRPGVAVTIWAEDELVALSRK